MEIRTGWDVGYRIGLAAGDEIRFTDDDDDARDEEVDDLAAPAWVVMIVDDDQGVHDATLLALAGERIQGRPLRFRHAYSARDAADQLRAAPDVAVILLDLVMEAADAGLLLIPVIRALPGCAAIRIILRTGQPGDISASDVRDRFAVDGYITKARLTRTLLLEALSAALATDAPAASAPPDDPPAGAAPH